VALGDCNQDWLDFCANELEKTQMFSSKKESQSCQVNTCHGYSCHTVNPSPFMMKKGQAFNVKPKRDDPKEDANLSPKNENSGTHWIILVR
jgi:hypothetical protein